MSTSAPTTAVTRSVLVDAPPEHCFRVFTEGIGSWWDPAHHLLEAPLAEMIFEPRVGGHIIDRGTDGSENRWARVLVYSPPREVVFSWDIGLDWKPATDLEATSEVAVSFTPEGAGTRVTLEHRHLDRHGPGWEAMRDAVDSGWTLDRYAEVASS